MVELAKRRPTLKQRIENLFDEEVIDADTYNELMVRERYTRGALALVRTKLEESFDDFMSRSHIVAQCRGRQHPWVMTPIDLGYRPTGCLFYETDLCSSCSKIRVKVINGIGRRDRTFYIDPPGFALEGVKTAKSDWTILARYMDLNSEVHVLEHSGQPTNVVPITSLQSA